MRTFIVIAVLAAVTLLCANNPVESEPVGLQAPSAAKPGKRDISNLLNIFGWGRKPEQAAAPAVAYGPCFQTTTTSTTPAPLGQQLCPLALMQSADALGGSVNGPAPGVPNPLTGQAPGASNGKTSQPGQGVPGNQGLNPGLGFPAGQQLPPGHLTPGQQLLPGQQLPTGLELAAEQLLLPGQQPAPGKQLPSGQQFLPGQQLPSGQQLLPGQKLPSGQQLLPGQQLPSGQQLLAGQQFSSGQQVPPGQTYPTNLAFPEDQLPPGQFVQLEGFPPGPQGLAYLIYPGSLLSHAYTLVPGTGPNAGVDPLQNLPSQPSLPGVPPVPAQPSLPDVPTVPSQPGLPAVPEQPSLSGLPEVPAQPSLPDVPAVPSQPGLPAVPAQPSLPDVPPVPSQPGLPAVPAQPSLPDVPAVPSQPAVPNQPSLPAVPTVLGQPSTPSVQAIPGIGATGFIFDTPDGLPPPGWVFPVGGPLQTSSSNIQVVSAPYPIDAMQPTCAGLPAGPYIPPGYYAVDNQIQQQQCMDKCGLSPTTQVPCSMIQVFDQLKLRTIYNLTVEAGLELLFLQTTNYTFFAPVDPAFDRLPAWFMQALRSDRKLLIAFVMNHFIKIEIPLESLGNEFLVSNARGSPLRINVYNPDTDYRIYTVDGSKVLVGGIHTTTGILHLVDKVVMPVPFRNVAEYLTEVPDFSNFLKAVIDSGLLPYFQEDFPITVFIPYDAAFKSIDYAAIAKDPNALKNFVLFHVVNGTYFSSGLSHGQYLTTNYYKEIKISVQSDGFTRYADTVNGRIRIIKPDIPLKNGVAHIVESVLTLDPNFYVYEELSEFSSEFGTFKRNMVLNKQELLKDFTPTDKKSTRTADKKPKV